MEVEDVPSELQHRLGPDGTAALVELLEQARQDWTVDVTTAAVERFDRRLSDAHVQLREDMIARDAKLREEFLASHAQLREETRASNAQLREEMRTSHAQLREEMRTSTAQLREEMRAGDAELRLDMTRGFATVREDLGVLKFDLLKWNFAFWVGQIVAVATVVGVMLRVMQT